MKWQDFKKFIKKNWQTKKGKALIKLGGYFLGMAIIIVFLLSFSKNPTQENNIKLEKTEEKVKTYADMQEDILKNNYAYKYIAQIDDNKYLFTGVKFGKEELGYKETLDFNIKYYINGNNYYQITLDSRREYPLLYDNINIDFLDVSYILGVVSTEKTIKSYEEGISVNKYEFLKDGIKYTISILNDENNIIKIINISKNGTYVLEFSRVGEIEQTEVRGN